MVKTDGNGLLDLVFGLLSICHSPCPRCDAGYHSSWEHARWLSSASTFLNTRLAVVKLDFAPGHIWELVAGSSQNSGTWDMERCGAGYHYGW